MNLQLSSGRRELAAAAVVYAAVMAFWFWPLFTQLGSAVLGGPGDGTQSIRNYLETSHVGKNIFSLPRDMEVAAPQGEQADAGVVASPLQAGFVTLASRAVGGIAAWNIFILVAFAASALGTFAVLKYVGVSFLPALFGGYVFGFNPWQFEKALEGHGLLTQTWIFPLLLWTLLRVRRHADLQSAALTGTVIALAFYTNGYFLLFSAVIAAVFAIVSAVRRDSSLPLRLWILASGVAVSLIAPFALYATVATDISTVDRPITDLQRFGAAPLEYIIPSPRNPVFGHWANGLFSASDTRHFAEPTLYFGLTTIALAILGAIVTLKRPSTEERRTLAIFGAALVVVAFVMSLPRKVTIASLTLPAPAWAIGQVTTLWRVYARFAVVVGFGLVILAALGADYVRRRTGRSWPLVLIGALAAFELAVNIPLPTWKTAAPPYVSWLAKAPRGIVAEYPMFEYGPAGIATIQAASYFYQAEHHQPLFDVYGDSYRTPLGVRAVRAAAVDVSSARTPPILAAEHVRYVVVHDDVYAKDGLKVPTLAPGLKIVWQSGGVRIARVTAAAAPVQPVVAEQNLAIARTLGAVPALASFGAGAVPSPQAGFVQLTGDAQITLNDPNPPTDWLFQMQLDVRAAGSHGRLQLLSNGRVVAATTYAGNASVVLSPFLLHFGIQRLELRAIPQPTAAQPLTVSFAPVVVPRLPPSAIAEAGATQPPPG